MKKIVLDPVVEISLRTLDEDGVKRVTSWFSYLERWDTDEAVRKNSQQLPDIPDVYVMRTATDLFIFFRIDGDTITVLILQKGRRFSRRLGSSNGLRPGNNRI